VKLKALNLTQFDNVYLWTDYSGYDPEVSTSQGSSGLAFGLDYGAYPRARSILLGLNVIF